MQIELRKEDLDTLLSLTQSAYRGVSDALNQEDRSVETGDPPLHDHVAQVLSNEYGHLNALRNKLTAAHKEEEVSNGN